MHNISLFSTIIPIKTNFMCNQWTLITTVYVVSSETTISRGAETEMSRTGISCNMGILHQFNATAFNDRADKIIFSILIKIFDLPS